jgi:hypothetical protein
VKGVNSKVDLADPGEFPLKILHILDHSLPIHSGYGFRSQNLLREQRTRGWQPIGLTSWEQTTSGYSEIYSRTLGTSLPDCLHRQADLPALWDGGKPDSVQTESEL